MTLLVTLDNEEHQAYKEVEMLTGSNGSNKDKRMIYFKKLMKFKMSQIKGKSVIDQIILKSKFEFFRKQNNFLIFKKKNMTIKSFITKLIDIWDEKFENNYIEMDDVIIKSLEKTEKITNNLKELTSYMKKSNELSFQMFNCLKANSVLGNIFQLSGILQNNLPGIENLKGIRILTENRLTKYKENFFEKHFHQIRKKRKSIYTGLLKNVAENFTDIKKISLSNRKERFLRRRSNSLELEKIYKDGKLSLEQDVEEKRKINRAAHKFRFKTQKQKFSIIVEKNNESENEYEFDNEKIETKKDNSTIIELID